MLTHSHTQLIETKPHDLTFETFYFNVLHFTATYANPPTYYVVEEAGYQLPI